MPHGASGEGDRRGGNRQLGVGWQVVDGCRLTPDGAPIEIVLAHRALGLAIMELEPRWTPGVEHRLRARLAAAGFADRFPGHLPIIHRRLAREVLAELPMVLTEAFSWQDPLTIPAELDWIEGLREALGAADPEARTCAPVSAGASGMLPPADGAEPAARAQPLAPSRPGDLPSVARPSLAAQSAATDMSGAMPGAVAAPGRAAGAWDGRARRQRYGLVLAGAAIAAGIALAVVLTRQPAPEAPAAESGMPVAGMTGGAAPVLTQSAGAAPARPAATAEAATPSPQPAATAQEAVLPFAEPEAPRLEEAERVLAAQVPPEPMAPFPEPDAPRLEEAERMLAGQVPREPIAPFPEPEAPRLEEAERVLAAQMPPEPIAPFPEPDAPRLEEAERVLAARMPPEPIAPFPEPEAPRLEEAERALAAALAPPLAVPAGPAASAVPTPAAPRMAPEMVEMLLRRGRELMAVGDVSAARRFFERAAAGGSGQAALEAGATYDPRVLQGLGARGLPPDREKALAWYRRAAALGVADAEPRIRALEAMP